MKRSSILTMVIIALATLLGNIESKAQRLTFGHLSYDSILTSMSDYATAQESMKTLRQQYDKEAEYNEDKFFKLYSEYIQGQKSFPEDIMLKRQKELQVAMEQGISFRKDAERLLNNAEAELLKPIEQKLNDAIAVVAKDRGLSFVVNTDAKAYPYINPEDGIDITALVKMVLEGLPLPKEESVVVDVLQEALAPDATVAPPTH